MKHVLPATLAIVLSVGLLAVPADAKKRNCKRLCRAKIAQFNREHCLQYHGRLRRLCKADVRETTIGFCQRQESGDCLGL